MKAFIAVSLLLSPGILAAKLNLPVIFSDGAVLQQETGSKIWGWSDPGTTVTVSFGDHNASAKADAHGTFSLSLTGLKANANGQELKVTNGPETVIVKDVLVGEVWLASGQSNMEWTVSNSNGAQEEIASANDPLLRVFTSANVAKATPQHDWSGRWNPTQPDRTGSFTAVGYYFGKRIRQEVGVPVGIIECSWGGKPVEAFISEEALKALPEAKGLIERKAKAIASWDAEAANARFEKQKAEYQKKLAAWKQDKKGHQPRGPRRPEDPAVNPSMHSNIYNGMIAPIVGYGARGALWYQGESNANHGSANEYEELLGCMIKDWRTRWGTDLSFYFVQLANYRQPTTKPGVESDWVIVQDEMRRALKSIPNSGMAIINDIGAANDIHPRNKKDVGERLARWALAHDYGKTGHLISGPLFAGAEKDGNKMIISFDHADGLKSRDGKPLKRFEIAGEDGTWHWGQAKLQDGKVIVWNDQIASPKKVRYAWAENPEGANLVNKDGLPASCFTTE
ncbi:MAG: sialate O-acetylesterase [Verrucomicrobiaceae bacterium]